MDAERGGGVFRGTTVKRGPPEAGAAWPEQKTWAAGNLCRGRRGRERSRRKERESFARRDLALRWGRSFYPTTAVMSIRFPNLIDERATAPAGRHFSPTAS